MPRRTEAAVEILNGYRVPRAYYAYWREHPEIGLPLSDPAPDGSQLFEHAILTWEEGRVVAHHRPEAPGLAVPPG